eukprot:TRINITY_DN15466_c0_g2_i1.p1 TRINITY_DN15466_c0_g2~~TRINITY_DN15466_c0_g2_i1.p1  ORF type:complete len:548 (-),score=120.59 TRINITY_DN15466_c0_g2_i1:278-1900(-)
MIRRPPRSTHCISSAASDVYKRQGVGVCSIRRVQLGCVIMEDDCVRASMMREVNEVSSRYGSSMADFEVVCELGHGSYGVVYKVKARKDLNNVYALKKLPIQHMKPKRQKKALQEVLLLKQLSHPNIIRYYTSFIEVECLHILMEYATQGDLHATIRKMKYQRKQFEEEEIWRFARELGQGLQYLHSKNIIHRDIKCLNIFLSHNTIKIGDLGVSKIVVDREIEGTRVGTPLYLSPELVKQQPYDYKVDMWALGCVLHYVAALEPPFQGDNLIALGNNIVSSCPRPLPSAYSAKLREVVGKLMAKKAADRPSASEVLLIISERSTLSKEENVNKVNGEILPSNEKPLFCRKNLYTASSIEITKGSKVFLKYEKYITESVKADNTRKPIRIKKKNSIYLKNVQIKQMGVTHMKSLCNDCADNKVIECKKTHAFTNYYFGDVKQVVNPVIYIKAKERNLHRKRPTLEMLRNAQCRIISSLDRPTTAELIHPNRQFKKYGEDNVGQNVAPWQRPQSAMQLGKFLALSTIARPNYKEYFMVTIL